jgi:Na+-transporting methylmalonyl-CoA/oxaloacetate decarboxylase gamma subunit
LEFNRAIQRPKLLVDESKKPRGSMWSIVAAGVFGLILFLGFLPLAGAAMYVALGAGVVFVVLSCVAALHYFVWGRWLGDAIRREVEEEEREKQNLQKPLSE